MILTYKNKELTIYNLTCVVDDFDSSHLEEGYPALPSYPTNLTFAQYFFDKRTDVIQDAKYVEKGYDHISSLKITYHKFPVIPKKQFKIKENKLKYCNKALFFMPLLNDVAKIVHNNFRNIDFKSYINTSVNERNYKEHNKRCIKYILENDLTLLISKLPGISKISKLLVCINHGKEANKPIGKLPFELAGQLLTFIDLLESEKMYKEDREFDHEVYFTKVGKYFRQIIK